MIDYFIAILCVVLFIPGICCLLFLIENGGDDNDKT